MCAIAGAELRAARRARGPRLPAGSGTFRRFPPWPTASPPAARRFRSTPRYSRDPCCFHHAHTCLHVYVAYIVLSTRIAGSTLPSATPTAFRLTRRRPHGHDRLDTHTPETLRPLGRFGGWLLSARPVYAPARSRRARRWPPIRPARPLHWRRDAPQLRRHHRAVERPPPALPATYPHRKSVRDGLLLRTRGGRPHARLRSHSPRARPRGARRGRRSRARGHSLCRPRPAAPALDRRRHVRVRALLLRAPCLPAHARRARSTLARLPLLRRVVWPPARCSRRPPWRCPHVQRFRRLLAIDVSPAPTFS